MLALQAVTPERLAADVPEVTLAEARKLIAQVHRGEPIHASSSVRRAAAEAVRARAHVPTLEVIAESASAIDPFVKYLLASSVDARGMEREGHSHEDRIDARDRFETVRIPLEVPGRFTVCVSSQVGCALGCAFCATGRLGLRRNLHTWEIVEQVRIVRARLANHRVVRDEGTERDAGAVAAGAVRDPGAVRDAREAIGRVHGVVFQGMGEPLANLDSVLQAIAVMTDPCALGIDARAITVCTAGLPSGIRRLAREAPNVRLGLSISSAIPAHRKRVMPVADKHDFDEVIAACEEHARSTGHAPMWAVTLLAGVNDSDADAHALAARARAFADATGKRPRITLLDYNPIGDVAEIVVRDTIGAIGNSGGREPRGDTPIESGRDPFTRSSRLGVFRDVLSAAGLPSHRRYSGGSDVAAACGQLAARS
ncbi:MAG: RNA methyltransferase [Kofleriaceae bacterium]